MNYLRHPELIDRLAAEYVLGTLRGPARLRFQRLADEHASVRSAVRDWEERLTPLAAGVAEVAPPERVWKRIAARIDQEARSSGSEQRVPARASTRPSASIWDNLAFWRNWGLVATGCAAALLVAVLVREQPAGQVAQAPAKNYIATLRDQSGNVAMIAVAAKDSRELEVRRLALPDAATGQSLELWGLPADKSGKPTPLGLIPDGEKGRIQLASAASTSLGGAPALAISIEPAGGSKTGLPTGPVLYSGPCIQFW